MRTLPLAAFALLLAAPAHAGELLQPVTGIELAQTAPDLDEDGCIALATKMDTAAKAKQKPTDQERSDYGECVSWFNCEKAQQADDATLEAAAATNESLIRFVLKTCTGYDPKPLTPGEKFMREKP